MGRVWNSCEEADEDEFDLRVKGSELMTIANALKHLANDDEVRDDLLCSDCQDHLHEQIVQINKILEGHIR